MFPGVLGFQISIKNKEGSAVSRGALKLGELYLTVALLQVESCNREGIAVDGGIHVVSPGTH